MASVRLGSAKGGLPQSLTDSVKQFAKEYPQCETAEYAPLYIITLTVAILIDRSPSAALVREYQIANSKLRRAVLGDTETNKEPTLADIIAGAGDS